jgi:ATP-binding cassette subfamily B multidrug efflux pump
LSQSKSPEPSTNRAAPAPAPSQAPSVAPFLSPDAAQISNARLVLWMFRFLKPVSGLVLMACLYLTLWVAAEVLTNRQAGEAANHIKTIQFGESVAGKGFFAWSTSPDPQPARLRQLTGGLALLVAAYGLLRYLREVANARMSMEMVFYIREAVYDKLQRVGFGFHDAVSSGQLINRALSDLQNVRQFVQTAVLVTLEIALVVLGNILLLLTRHPWVALLAVVPLPVWTWYILRFSKKVQPAAKAVMEAEDRNVSLITENIAGVHVVKAFATESYEIEKYGRNCDTFKDRVLTRIRLFADFQPVIRTIAMASMLSLFLLAAFLMLKRKMEPGDLLILGTAMTAILSRLEQVGTINEQYQNAVVSSRRLYEVLMAVSTVPEPAGAPPLPPGAAGTVRFENVTFGYDPGRPVLHDVSFEAPGGSIVAIVGPTGAGKSTLVNLIARFYDPQKGRVLIDGVDVRDVSLASLRTQVAFVFQETHLFSDTVAGNIAYGRPAISRGDVEAAARLAQAHEFIDNLPTGYETMLGERGSSLSGGQRQRLAIARAILTNPRVLILDDATAAVDPETEDLIRRGMRLVMRGRTTFVIAHRISTVKRADLVLVVENGRITQSGTHAQLMREAGHYRQIAAVQLYGDEAADGEGTDDESPSHMKRIRDEHMIAAATAAGKERGDASAGGV